MSKSFFEAAIFLNQPQQHQGNTLKTKEIKKLILAKYFLDKQRLAELKKAMSEKRLDGSCWREEDDEIVIEEYLSSLSNQKLNRLLQALTLKAINSFYALPVLLNFFITILTPIVNSYYIFQSSGSLLGFLSNWLYAKKIAKNPEIELTPKEEKLCSKYSQLFKECSSDNKKYHKLYREVTKTADSSEQVLSGLLYYLKSLDLRNEYQALEVSKMLLKIEQQLLNGKISDPEVMRNLEALIKSNLEQAYVYSNQQMDFDFCSNQSRVDQIYNIINLFKDIVRKIIEKEQQLEKAALTKIELYTISNFVLNYKRKVLHFIVKTNAFAKEETLKPGVPLHDPYIIQGNKYSTYLDFWLSKVPKKISSRDDRDLSNAIVLESDLEPNHKICKEFYDKQDLVQNVASIDYNKLDCKVR